MNTSNDIHLDSITTEELQNHRSSDINKLHASKSIHFLKSNYDRVNTLKKIITESLTKK